jgi:anti-anti-sigma factor
MKPPIPVAEDKVITYRLAGDLVSTNTEKVQAELARLLEPRVAGQADWQMMRVDMQAANRVDSSGLNLIVTLLKAVTKAGARLQIICRNPNVLRSFVFTHLDRQVEVIKVEAPPAGLKA